MLSIGIQYQPYTVIPNHLSLILERVCDRGGKDDGHNKDDHGGGSCTPVATRGGGERASLSLAGMDLLLYKDSGRRAMARLRM